MNLVGFDVETWGTLPEYALQPYRAKAGDAWLTSAVFSFGNRDDGTLRPSVEWLRDRLNECAENNVRIVAWNSAFDVSWLIALGLRDEVYKNKWLDGMLLWRHLKVKPTFLTATKETKQQFGLKAAVATYFPEEAGYEKNIDFGTTDPDELKLLLEYNIKDAKFTRQLARTFLEELSPETKRIALIEAGCIPLVAESMINGIKIDRKAAVELDERLEEDANVAFVTLKLDNPEVTPEILASPQQLGKLLYLDWQLHIPKLTDKKKASTDKEALAALADYDPRAKLVHEYREAKNNRTKFVQATLESIEYNGDEHTRPQFRIYGTYTGRGTYSSTQGKGKNERQTGVALHQWKREAAFRKLITVDNDYVIVEFDFSGQEFRWMGVCSGDSTMLQMCAPGEDAHAFMGARVAGVDYQQLLRDVAAKVVGAKDNRQLGKVANLSLQYRTSANKLMVVAKTQYGIVLTQQKARAIHATYQTTYRAVPAYWKRQIYLAKTQGYIQNLVGRTVQLGDPDTWDQQQMWSYESTAINFPIQSIGADQKYLALLVMRDYLPKVDGRFLFELHDGVFFAIPKKYADKAVREMRHKLSNLPYKQAWGLDLPIQFPVDAKMGPSWGELQEIKD